jgi:1,4-alpha-glucan branching enzyme
VPRPDYKQGVPHLGTWRVKLTSDDLKFGGSGAGTHGTVEARQDMTHGQPASVQLDLPPLGLLILEKVPDTQ